MSYHPINLGIRFLLEMVALISIAFWGWHHTDEVLRILLGVGLPVFLAAIWAGLAVPNDPSRSGEAPININGIIRLIIEMVFFAIALLSIYDLGNISFSIVFGVIVLLHYLVSYERILWLLSQ